MKLHVNQFIQNTLRVFPPQNRYGKLRFDMNENPEGLPKEEVVTVAPSFEMYWVNCNILGYKHVPVPYESDLTIKASSLKEAA